MSNEETIIEDIIGDHEYKVVEMMYKYGGSFVKALSEAFYRADHINFKKLKNAFPEYWKEYSAMANDGCTCSHKELVQKHNFPNESVKHSKGCPLAK